MYELVSETDKVVVTIVDGDRVRQVTPGISGNYMVCIHWLASGSRIYDGFATLPAAREAAAKWLANLSRKPE